MDSDILAYYNRELAYIRELGSEFAQQHPKIAGRLGMQGIDVADPYVERLLEGFSFLTARIQMKMDAEFPAFSQRLLETVYPSYLAPTPTMAVVEMQPDLAQGSLETGYTVPRGTIIHANLPKGEQTPCEFMTGHAVDLWPVRIASVAITGAPADLPLARFGLSGQPAQALGIRGALRIRLEALAGTKISALPIDQLLFYLSGPEIQANRLLELILGHTVAVLCHDGNRPARWIARLDQIGNPAVRHEGFDPQQALLPYDARSFQGYRLLQEYFAFPARFLFFSINGLRQALRQSTAESDERGVFEITLLFNKSDPELESIIDAQHLALYCTPIINLFPRRGDHIAITPKYNRYHLVGNRTRPMDSEVYCVTQVTGHYANNIGDRLFRPFYESLGCDDEETNGYGAYYSVHREPRVVSEQAYRNGTRTGYIGSEVFLSLVDQRAAPISEDLRHLTVDTLCTNRDLGMLIPLGAETDFICKISAPVSTIKVLRGPTRPRPALANKDIAWHLISHLSLNYLSLIDLNPEQGAAALRELLNIYSNLSDSATRKQIDGVRSVQLEPIYRRIPGKGPLVYGRGVRVVLTIDEGAFSGINPFLFGAVMAGFFTRHVSLNMFAELTLHNLQHNELAHWAQRPGGRPVA